MNIIELQEELGKVQKSVRELHLYALGGFDLTLDVDQQWNVSTDVSPAREEHGGKAKIRYENLWTKVTPAMTNKVARRIKDLSLTLEARLLQASASIQKDILTADFGGIISFWRSDREWMAPQVHHKMRQSDKLVVFVDAFSNHGVPEAFRASNNLIEMRLSYQADFICKFWPDFNVDDEKSVIYSEGPPPVADKDSCFDGVIFS